MNQKMKDFFSKLQTVHYVAIGLAVVITAAFIIMAVQSTNAAVDEDPIIENTPEVTKETKEEEPEPLPEGYFLYTIKDGESLQSIALAFNIDLYKVLWANGYTTESTPKVGDEIIIPSEAGTVIEIEEGDTLDSIATEYDIDPQLIVAKNKLETPFTLTPGQYLLLPGYTPPTEDSLSSDLELTQWWEYPEEIFPATRLGDDLLVLVNKKYQLPSTYVPTDLVDITGIDARVLKSLQIRSEVLDPLGDLSSAALEDGIDLSITSAYRSYTTQESTYQYWVDYNGGNVAAADTVSARPGHSQHQLGTAIDFSTNEANDQLGQAFNVTAANTWLEENAWEYGFALSYPEGEEEATGYSYEGWHYRYIGVENAKLWHDSGLILEHFLKAASLQ